MQTTVPLEARKLRHQDGLSDHKLVRETVERHKRSSVLLVKNGPLQHASCALIGRRSTFWNHVATASSVAIALYSLLRRPRETAQSVRLLVAHTIRQNVEAPAPLAASPSRGQQDCSRSFERL